MYLYRMFFVSVFMMQLRRGVVYMPLSGEAHYLLLSALITVPEDIFILMV